MYICNDFIITILLGYFCCQVGTPNVQHFQNLLWFFFCSWKLRICPQFHSLDLELDIANKHYILQFLCREKRQKFSLLYKMVTRYRTVSKTLFIFMFPALLAPVTLGHWWAGTALPAFFLLLYSYSHFFTHTVPVPINGALDKWPHP